MTMAAGGHPSSPLLGHDGAALRRYEGPVQRLRAHGLMLLWALGLIAAVLACLPPAAQVRGTAEAAQRRVAPDAAPLMLTALLEEGRTAEARAASRVVVHGVALGHSGYFSVPSASGRNTNHLFTWYQPCEGCDPRTAPLIQWFNGGPGSPDTAGAFNQIGKFYVGPDLRLRARCFSWCRTANCLFVDSPVMTGFSYQTNASGGFDRDRVEYTATSAAAAEQVLQVLLQFLRLWPEHRRAPYYVQGLSYAGIYVPHMARAVLRHNRRGGAPRIDLRGIAAGDPVMDNAYQYPTYAPALEALGLLMEDEARRVDAIMRRAARWSARDCARSFAEWNRVWNDDGGSSCAPHCEFLFRRFTGSENTEHVLLGAQPRAFAHFRRFLMGHVAAFHVAGSPVLRGPGPALAEGGAVYAAMVRSGDLCGPSAPLYASLFLDEGLDVVVYAGNMDPLLGPAMTAAGVRAAWDYAAANVSGGAAARAAFYRREKQVWRIAATDAAPAGYAKCLERPGHRFCYVVVRGAGHEAASYAPRAMYDLNERFLHRRAFAGDAPAGGTPQCAPCGGAPPFAGGAVAACADVPPLW